ncbi:MAG: S-layer protein [Candidatus Aenigmarchaeota archaeon]|nr:S-layer protein [Candidatus Aenigmarchaeota archaeon]
MRFLVEETKEGQRAFETILIDNPRLLPVLSNELALKIIRELGKQPACAMDIARRLKVHEQKVYYHMRNLERLGLIKVVSMEERVGAIAKIYSPISSVVSFKLFDGERINDIKTRAAELKFLKPFVQDGKLNSIIVVGSPDPHGKYKAPASDGYCAIDLGMFLGQFIVESKIPYYKLDTQVQKEDFENNLIVIGGPKTNIIADKINKQLPIYFDYSEEFLEWNIVSTLSKTVYREAQSGFIARIPSPFSNGKEILVFSGKGFKGTRAAVLAFIKHLKKIMEGNSVKHDIIAKVVQGIDVDSDGIIDEVEFLE